MDSDIFNEDHELFGKTVREFVARRVEPQLARWDADRLIDRGTWEAAGAQGLLGLAVPPQYGGPGETDYRFRMMIQLEIGRVGASALQSGFSTNDDIVLNYLLRHANDEQKERWLPGFVTGTTIGAIAMTEPAAGSDLRGIRTKAVREGDAWIVSGSKTFISSGILADLVIVFAKTASGNGKPDGFSLFVIEEGMPGFSRGRKLDKIGLHAQDTAELFFDSVRVPTANLLGEAGRGFEYLMESLPLERLGIAIAAQANAEAVLAWTLDYVRNRKAFGRRIADFQSLSFALAEMATKIEVTRAFVDRCVLRWNVGTLSAVDAAKAKFWATDMQGQVVDAAVQMHGGYGYMTEYPVARAFVDARIQRIYGGTNEIMKEIIQRDLIGRAPTS